MSKPLTMIPLFLLFALGAWWVGRDCFVGVGLGHLYPWLYCDNGCYESIWVKAPWLEGPALWPESGKPGANRR